MISVRKSILAFSGCSVGLLISGCFSSHVGSTDKLTEADLPKVATVKPERKTLVQKTVQPGQIEAFHNTPIFAKVGGYVDQLHVDIGDRVRGPQQDGSGKIVEQGQLLARLAAPELKEELQQKEAMVAQAEAEVEQFESAVAVAQSLEASAAATIEENQAGQQRAEANVERWKSELDRVRELADKKAVTQKLADETDQQHKAAQASQAEAIARTRSAKAKHQEVLIAIQKARADSKTVKAQVNVAKADRDRVAALCSYLEIRAPYDGVVTARNIDLGVLVLPARGGNEIPVFNVIQADTVRIFLGVPESDAVLVEIGRPVIVRVPALESKTFTGTVTRTGWALQTGTRTLNCEIDIRNPDGILRPGMYAHVDLVVAQRENALSLPKTAVTIVDGQTACLIVDANDLVEQKIVQVGIRTDTNVEIVSGLDGTESVISANVSAFRGGQKVAPSAK